MQQILFMLFLFESGSRRISTDNNSVFCRLSNTSGNELFRATVHRLIENVSCGMNFEDYIRVASAGRQEATADQMTSGEFVDVGSIGNSEDASNIRELRSIVHRLLQACDNLTLPTVRAASTSTQPGIEQRTLTNTVEQTTQTESIANQYSDERVTECCARRIADMEKLKVKLKQVVDMNVQWQLWHDDCQKHTSDLEKQINELRQQMNATSVTTTGSESSVQLVNDLGLSDNRSRQGNYSGTTPEDSVHVSRCNNSDRVKSDIKDMEAQDRNLRKELEEAHSSTSKFVDRLTSEIHEKQSLIEVLKAQVVLYREDFENERQDRQQAQSKLVALEAQLGELKKTTTCRQQPSLRRVPSAPVVRRYVVASTPAATSSPHNAALGMRRSTTEVSESYRLPLHGPRQYRHHNHDARNMGYFDDIESDA